MSASRIDAFYKCRFNYLFKYILYLNKARPAEIDVLNRGTIVHYVLENIIKKYKNKISAVSKEETIKEVDFYMIEYLKSMEAEDLLHDIRFKYIYDKISTLAKRTMFRIIEEFSNSDFKPEFCEFSIGNDIPPLEIKGENNIKIIGYIDRVDLLENEQNKYVRIVDYKSSNMKISINNILYGLNLQMLIYLYAYTKNSNAIPAGVFYLPVNGGFTDTNPTMKMNGLMLNDLDIYQSMDNNNTGKFLPNFGSKERRDNPLIEQDDFDIVFKYIESKIKDMENTILNGDFNISPVDLGNGTSCKYCDFKSICRIENEGLINKVDTSLDTNNAIDYMKGKINGV